jgi:hypothetical protein
MPHAVYYALFLFCPWPGCDFQIAMVDFNLEKSGIPDLYARVVLAWNSQPGYGVVARCPGCGQYVWFGKDSKQAVPDPPTADLEVLPDDWHQIASIV